MIPTYLFLLCTPKSPSFPVRFEKLIRGSVTNVPNDPPTPFKYATD